MHVFTDIPYLLTVSIGHPMQNLDGRKHQRVRLSKVIFIPPSQDFVEINHVNLGVGVLHLRPVRLWNIWKNKMGPTVLNEFPSGTTMHRS